MIIERIDTENGLSHAQWAFIDRLDRGAGTLRSGFEDAFNVPLADRYDWAQDRLYDIKRRRFTKRGVPCHDTETVGDHVLDSIGMATVHTPFTCHRDMVERMILVHDMPQAIIDNLKCVDSVSKKDMKRAVKMAAEIVFEDRPAAMALWQEYEDGVTPEARVAKDIQHAQMLIKVQEYQDKYPHTRITFKEYWDAFDTMWVSDAAKTLQALFVNSTEICANDVLDKHNNTSCVA
jgi:5'-deoxynucleotidase YfbR-like HD superfamily hydrolase